MGLGPYERGEKDRSPLNQLKVKKTLCYGMFVFKKKKKIQQLACKEVTAHSIN